MTFAAALVAMSHSPLLGIVSLDAEDERSLSSAVGEARRRSREFEPDVVVLFHPDHYNGFFYDLMPQFCVGTAATAIGDFATASGPLNVPASLAADCAAALLDGGVDVAISHAMRVDHGAAQPLESLFGSLDAVPVIPIFVNCVAPPFCAISRVRALGETVGRFAADLGAKVLFVASGGLSHDPPVPRLAGAEEAVRANLLGAGRNLTPEGRAARQQRVIDAAGAFALGEANIQPLAPDWDMELMDLLARGDLTPLDAWTSDEIARRAGNSAHEVRTWIAAHAALGAIGAYRTQFSFYREMPSLIAGFGVTFAELTARG